MKRYLLCAMLAAALLGCAEREDGTRRAEPATDPGAGRAFAERECKGCHGLDGRGAAAGIPHLAGQRERYLAVAIRAYKEGKRPHAALRQMAGRMSESDVRNVAAFYAGLAPVVAREGVQAFSPYERGRELAGACAKCHGADGNSTTPGVPNLAGQQPRYLVLAMEEYLHRERKKAPMHALLLGLGKLEKESLALYFASQAPTPRPAPPFGNPAAGEPLTAVCGGCHGARGVSNDTATPSLASQEPRYLVEAIKAYRTTRKREAMRAYVAGLGARDIENIAAFYTVQKSGPAERGQTLVKELTDKCERCHGATVDPPGLAVPKIRGQDRDYLAMALRAYRDDRRESTVMHKMSLPYSDAIIEAISSFYAGQPAQ